MLKEVFFKKRGHQSMMDLLPFDICKRDANAFQITKQQGDLVTLSSGGRGWEVVLGCGCTPALSRHTEALL